MRDKQGRDAQLAVQLLNLQPGLYPQFGVQVGQRLIKQKQLRLAHDGPAHGHALTLPARQGARLAVQQMAQLEDLGSLVNPRADLVFGHLGDFQSVGHVVKHAHVRVQRIVLEHHRDIALGRLQRVDHAIADRDGAAADFFEPGHHAQQGRLAAA